MCPFLYTIILPTYNEKENIKTVLDNIGHFCHDLNKEVIIVDDNSPDGTYEHVTEISKYYDFPILTLKRSTKMGLGTAYKYAMAYATGNWIILMDSDMSHHPRYIPEFVKVKDDTAADIVSGSRYAPGGDIKGWGWHRIAISKTANCLAATLLGLRSKATDLTGSFRLYNTSVLKSLLGEISSSGYSFQMETLLKAIEKGHKIKEYPIVFSDRVYGKSKLGVGEIVKFVIVLIQLTFSRACQLCFSALS